MLRLHKKKNTKEEKRKESSSIDFHLEIVEKLDRLFKEEDQSSEIPASDQEREVSASQPFAEMRSPLEKQVTSSEVCFEEIVTKSSVSPSPLPKEFQPEFPFIDASYFKFIETLDISQGFTKDQSKDDRIEVIDVQSFMVNEKNVPTKRIEIIPMGSSPKKGGIHVFSAASQNIKKADEKSGLYYMKSAKNTEKKTSYIPVDFETRLRAIKEQEEEKQQPDDKEQKKQEKKLQKLEVKKAKLEQKQKKKEEKLKLKEIKKQHKEKIPDDKKEEPNSTSSDQEEPPLIHLDDDVRELLRITDALLGELPDEIIEQFANSKEFELYQKVLSKYRIK